MPPDSSDPMSLPEAADYTATRTRQGGSAVAASLEGVGVMGIHGKLDRKTRNEGLHGGTAHILGAGARTVYSSCFRAIIEACVERERCEQRNPERTLGQDSDFHRCPAPDQD